MAGAALLGEVDVGLVQRDDAVKARVAELLHLRVRDSPGRGVARRGHEHDLGGVIGGGDHRGNVQLERRRQRRHLDVNVVHLGADLVHAVGGRRDQDAVLARVAEDADEHVEPLVAANTQENLLLANATELSNLLLELPEVRRRVALEHEAVPLLVERRAEGVLVGVEEHARVVVVARAAVGLQLEDVRPHQILQLPAAAAGALAARRR
mmetsp:Transcript_3915/g.11337  ORF Transcript_3915/g.11337 Transcript_3915/m.11337 type:complete len:209 (-) Transcript_3915:156-782(-)